MATHSSILAWRIPMDREAWRAAVHGIKKRQTRLKRLSTAHIQWLSLFQWAILRSSLWLIIKVLWGNNNNNIL